MSEVREMTVKEAMALLGVDTEPQQPQEGQAVASTIQSGVLSDIEAGLKEAGIIPPEASLVDAKLIDDTYFMVKLG
mgnify:CR=1 FL=1